MAWTYSPVHTGNLPGLNVYTAPSKYAGFSAYSSPVISIFLMCWLCCIRCVFCWWPARFDRFLLPLVTTVEFSGPVPALAVVPTACLTAGRCSIRPCTSAFPFLWRNGLDVFDLDSSEEYRLVIFVECLPSVVLSVSSWLNSSSHGTGLCCVWLLMTFSLIPWPRWWLPGFTAVKLLFLFGMNLFSGELLWNYPVHSQTFHLFIIYLH